MESRGLRDDSDGQLEHDEERLGNGALCGKRQDVPETGNVGKVVCRCVPQPELLRATHEGVSKGVPPLATLFVVRFGMEGCAILPTAPVAKGKRVPKHEPTQSDEGGDCDRLLCGRKHALKAGEAPCQKEQRFDQSDIDTQGKRNYGSGSLGKSKIPQFWVGNPTAARLRALLTVKEHQARQGHHEHKAS